MTASVEISFYHLTHGSLEKSVAKVLEKVYEAGLKSVLWVSTEEDLETYNKYLWTFGSQSFLPHGAKGGSKEDGPAERQPLYLSTEMENPNDATVLAELTGEEVTDFGAFKRCLDIFNGHDDDAVTKARNRWKSYKAKGYTLTYWKQDDTGKWSKQ